MTEREYLINSGDLARRLGSPIAYGGGGTTTGANWRLVIGKIEHPFKTWDGLAEWARDNIGVTEWVRQTQWGDWFPVAAAVKAKGMVWREGQEDEKKITWSKPGRPCEVSVSHDSWHFGPCSRVALDDGREMKNVGRTTRACKMHANAEDKRAANDRKWREEWDERDRQRQRAKELGRKVDDILPLLAQFRLNARKHEGHHGPSGDIVVDGEALESLAKRILDVQETLGIDLLDTEL